MSDGVSSVASTPDVKRRYSKVSSASSVPEGLSSPVRHAGPRATSYSSSNLAVDDSMTAQAPYLTPQNYKNVLPLQTAFMSTGLASKRNRPTMGNVDLVTGETLPPLPPTLNYALSHNASTSNAQLGLREVMAAANAHSAATVNKPATMPDTPMKKPGFPSFAVNPGAKAVPMGVTKGRSRHQPTFPTMLSPPKQQQVDGNDSSSSGGSTYGGDSPLLNQDCDSPTLGLTSVSGKQSWTPGSQRIQSPFRLAGTAAISPTHSISPTKKLAAQSYSISPEIHLSNEAKEAQSTEDGNNNSLSALGITRPSSLRTRFAAIQRPATAGLQRKGSFGPASEQAMALGTHSAVNSPILGSDFIPTTPTRNSTSIKWFEAAQLITTPSPSSRRRSTYGRRESYQAIGSNRNSRLRLSVGAGDSVETSKSTLMSVLKVSHFESRFNVVSTLGKGEFSRVDKVEDKEDGCLYAVKRMKKPYLGPRDRLRRLEEVDILNHLSQGGGHLNIIMLVDSWEESGSLFVQTELCPCVDFSSFLQHNSDMGGSMEEARLWKVYKELSDGLSYIHSKGVLHLDLKPANVFITEIATLKIGDFGLASRWPTVDANTILCGADMGDVLNADTNALTMKKGKNLEREGDREYIAPEIIFEGRYGKAADVFSLGLILLEAAGNVILPDNGEAWHKLRNNDLSDVDLSMISTSLIRLIQACLHSSPDKRPSAEQIQAHPVLQAVSRRVALGVQISELDQLPIFDLPSGDSSRSLKSKLQSLDKSRESSEDAGGMGDTEMDDGEGEGGNPKTPKTQERSASVHSALGLMGIEGVEVEENVRVLDIRGALIHESIDFLMAILEAEPDPSARLLRDDLAMTLPTTAAATTATATMLTTTMMIPKISVEGDESSSAGTGGPGAIQHAPFRASPLRQHGDEEENDMDMDQDEDIFIR